MACRKKMVIIAPANRWGKTQVLLGDAALTLQNRHPHYRTPNGVQLYFGVKTFKMIERTIMPQITRLLRRRYYDVDMTNMVIRMTKGDGAGSKLFFISADAELKTWESFSAWKFYLDEELPEPYVEATFTRALDNDGQIMWGMTLEQGTTWSHKKYLEPWLKGLNRDFVEVIRGTTWDNPFHDPEKITREYERMYSIDPVKADVRFKGAWLELNGSPFFGGLAMKAQRALSEKFTPRYGEIAEA